MTRLRAPTKEPKPADIGRGASIRGKTKSERVPSRQSGGRIEWSKLGRELAVTFVGVLLALAANAAWIRREEARREVAALAALQEDLAPYRLWINAVVAREDSAMHADTMILRMLRGTTPLVADSLRHWAHPLLWSGVPATPGTSLGLTQTGDATVLRDAALRARIERFVTRTNSAEAAIAQINTIHLEEWGRLGLILEPFATAIGPNESLDRLIRALPAMRESHEFRTALSNITVMRRNRVTQLKQLQTVADSLAETLRTFAN